jgi:hypothetical protein
MGHLLGQEKQKGHGVAVAFAGIAEGNWIVTFDPSPVVA